MSFVRELGAAERIYCREQTDHGNQTLVQVLIISNAHKINELTARQALVKLYQDYCPVLGYKICPSDDQTTLVYVSKDEQQAEQDLMSNFKYQQGTGWHEVFQDELNIPFDNDNLSRWIIINGNILIMSFHHGLVDAKNLFYISRQYLSLCSTLISVKPKNTLFLEPMEKYLFNKYSYEKISDLELKPRSSRPDPIISRTHVRHFYFSSQILDRLIEQSHSNKIRLNSILSVITATAYYLASDYNEEKTLKIHMMVNIRPHLKLDYEQPGMFVTVFDCFVNINQPSISSSWLNAIQQHNDLHRRINEKEYIMNCKNDTNLLNMINNNESFSCDDVHFAFSNLGLLSNTDDNQIEEHYFGVSLIEQRWTSAILVGVSTINGRLCFTIAYSKNKIEKAFIEKWIEKIYYLLEQI
ncbi:unnamed protein product [Rotaria magnacalcarata]|uniref:Alcohol acetyltransferase n=1 Tax=Rotaria magnacalcarata TaxID=392030 RepID=A0A815GH54_9BILA|nr:unnamed protein product [Rotaria magnacalcarata]CAF2049447.1 unnamed protein product [Rotaria magnacalcarata]CAF4115671.1 unnamed protein product [Rotaria magnacalcarata]CAF4149526.1 unnamed protein product [Rotaria magnacalcarata]CAF4206741.1 unnamed protein product [Rotaria magnacalcarata]